MPSRICGCGTGRDRGSYPRKKVMVVPNLGCFSPVVEIGTLASRGTHVQFDILPSCKLVPGRNERQEYQFPW